MKAVVLLAGMFLATSVTFAGNGENLVDRLVKRKVSYPEALRAQGVEATVNVKLRVVAGGLVEIIAIDSESEEMKAAVEKQLRQLKFKNPAQVAGKEFS